MSDAYSTTLLCKNCGNQNIATIDKGELIADFEVKAVCWYCGNYVNGEILVDKDSNVDCKQP